MIRLQFENAIFFYLLISVFGFLTSWLLFTKVSRFTKDNTQVESIWQCYICTYIYIDSKNKKISVCPRCGSYNEREEKGGKH